METRTNAPPIVACYREYEPCAELAGHVRMLFSFGPLEARAPRPMLCEFLFGPGERFPATFADGSASIVFNLGKSLQADGRWRPLATASGHVIGAMSAVQSVAPIELPAMVGAYLHPANVSAFIHDAAERLTDRIVSVGDIWKGARAAELAEVLATLDEVARLECLESVLLGRLKDQRESGVAAFVGPLAALVARKRGRITVESLANEAGVSRQRLTRVFRERVGVSPKLFCRLARFHSALAYARLGSDLPWARIALELGYADQSHMIAEFREFSSLTPERLSSERWFHPFIEHAKAARARRSGPTPSAL